MKRMIINLIKVKSMTEIAKYLKIKERKKQKTNFRKIFNIYQKRDSLNKI
jgi:hypothetical protein